MPAELDRLLNEADSGPARRRLKILFVLHVATQARHFTSALLELRRRGHQVTLLVEQKNRNKPLGVPEHLRHIEGLTLRPLVYPRGVWGRYARAFRATRNYLLYYHRAFDRSSVFRDRAYAWTDPHLRKQLPRDVPPSAEFVRYLEAVERAIPPAPEILELYRAEQPDIVLISPVIFYQNTVHNDYIKCAHAIGVPVGFPVFSWDNLTTKGNVQELPDRIWVWNEIQRRELSRYHGVEEGRVGVLGAWRFDEFRALKPSIGRETFCRIHELDLDRPIIAYLGSSPAIAPCEGDFVANWLQRIRASDDEAIANANVLIRAHPRNLEAWRAADSIRMHPNVHLQEPATTSFWDSQRLYDLLHFCHAAVGLNTSAMLEAAVLKRPVHTLMDPMTRHEGDGTVHFQYLADPEAGLLHVAQNIDEHLELIAASLNLPPHWPDKRAAEFCRTFMDAPDGAAEPTQTLTAEIEQLAQLSKQPVRRSSEDVLRAFALTLQLRFGLLPVGSDDANLSIVEHDLIRRARHAPKRIRDRLRRMGWTLSERADT